MTNSGPLSKNCTPKAKNSFSVLTPFLEQPQCISAFLAAESHDPNPSNSLINWISNECFL